MVYLDDILIYIKTFPEHLSHLRQVFKVLRKQKLYRKKERCHFSLERDRIFRIHH